MGVGYTVSPLHRIRSLDLASMTARPVVRGENPLLDLLSKRGGQGTILEGSPQYRLPAKGVVLAWRDRIARKYRDQLGEDLSWSEDSEFEQAEDTATGPDVLLRYVAAVMDQRGHEAARSLASITKPKAVEMQAVFAEATRRGFGGRFPQLLLGANYWFPFQRDMMIEEPDWEGNVERYGSVFRMMEELKQVRAFIADVDGRATAWTANRPVTSDDVLAQAWQASDTVARLGTVAGAQHLPLWTTG